MGAFIFTDRADREHYDRHLAFDHVVPAEEATQRQRFEAVSRTLRDLLTKRWLLTRQTHDTENPKRVYYLSMEFLIGRTLVNNIINLEVDAFVRDELRTDPRQDWKEVVEAEPDAGLGNGGLGRLAACFVESLATLQIPAMGYGLRYKVRNLPADDSRTASRLPRTAGPLAGSARIPGRVASTARNRSTVPIGCSFHLENGVLRATPGHAVSHCLAVPYAIGPVVGYGVDARSTRCVCGARRRPTSSTLANSIPAILSARLWTACSLTRSLGSCIPMIRRGPGRRRLRFVREYFLVCCSLGDIVATLPAIKLNDWRLLPDKVAIQLNDTHPAGMAVAELMRLLLEREPGSAGTKPGT